MTWGIMEVILNAVFDERSIDWTDNADYNIMYLRAELYGHFWSYGKGDRFVDLGIPKEYDRNTKSFELDINI